MGEFKNGVKTINKQLTDMNDQIHLVEKDFFQKALKSLEHKQNYYNLSETMRDFKLSKVTLKFTHL